MLGLFALAWLTCVPSMGQSNEWNDSVTIPVDLATSDGNVAGAAVVADDTSGYHAIWVDADGDLMYRGGRLGLMAPPRVLVQARQSSSARDVAAVATSTGGPAIAWSRRISAGDDAWDIFYRLSPSSVTKQLMGDAFPDTNPALAAQGDSLFLVWERHDVRYEIDYAVIVGNTVPPRQSLSFHDAPATRPRIVAGIDGLIWVVWTVHASAGAETWVAALDGDGVRVAPRVIRSGADDRRPSITVSPAGRPHIVWQHGEPAGAIEYSYGLLDSGALWGFAPVVTLANQPATNPSVAFIGDGVPRVTWTDAASGALRLVSVVGNDVIGPLVLAPVQFEPDQSTVSSAFSATPTGALISPFVGRSPSTGKSGVWVAFFGEAPTASLFGYFAADVEAPGAVKLTWGRTGAVAVDRFRLSRLRSGADTRSAVTIATVWAGWNASSEGRFAIVDYSSVAGGVFDYRIEALDADGRVLSARQVSVTIPGANVGFVVRPSPNPFNASTVVAMHLPGAGRVTLRIMDCSGRVIREWAVSDAVAGRLRVVWDGRDETGRPVGSGVYLARATYRGAAGVLRTVTTRVTLLR